MKLMQANTHQIKKLKNEIFNGKFSNQRSDQSSKLFPKYMIQIKWNSPNVNLLIKFFFIWRPYRPDNWWRWSYNAKPSKWHLVDYRLAEHAAKKQLRRANSNIPWKRWPHYWWHITGTCVISIEPISAVPKRPPIQRLRKPQNSRKSLLLATTPRPKKPN